MFSELSYNREARHVIQSSAWIVSFSRNVENCEFTKTPWRYLPEEPVPGEADPRWNQVGVDFNAVWSLCYCIWLVWKVVDASFFFVVINALFWYKICFWHNFAKRCAKYAAIG